MVLDFDPLEIVPLGRGSVFIRGRTFSAFQCKHIGEPYEYEDPEELDHRLTQPHLVDEYLHHYSRGYTDLNFDQWLEEQTYYNHEKETDNGPDPEDEIGQLEA
jgi:hypothetical protein